MFHGIVDDRRGRLQIGANHRGQLIGEPASQVRMIQAVDRIAGRRGRLETLDALGHPVPRRPAQHQPGELAVLREAAQHQPAIGGHVVIMRDAVVHDVRDQIMHHQDKGGRAGLQLHEHFELAVVLGPVARLLHGREQCFLVGKVLVEQRFRDPGRVRQLTSRGTMKPFTGENAPN